MTDRSTLILGESQRVLGERYRVSVPGQMVQGLGDTEEFVLVKERPGALSLWNARRWEPRWQQDAAFIKDKLEAGRLADRLDELQRWGRLLSTRSKPVRLAERGRLVIPEGFREFLGVEPGGSLMIVGAAVCVELWDPQRWREHLAAEIPKFRELEGQLST